jgi:hypothetical protein
MFVPHRKHANKLPRPDAGIYIYICRAYLTGNTSIELRGLLLVQLYFFLYSPLWSSDQELLVADPEAPDSIPGATTYSDMQWGLEPGPLSLVRINEELFERKGSGSSLEMYIGRLGPIAGPPLGTDVTAVGADVLGVNSERTCLCGPSEDGRESQSSCDVGRPRHVKGC